MLEKQTQSMSTSESSRSAKLPNAPLLSDGKSPTFELWRMKVKDKLAFNADHYTPRARAIYV
jgi:hypothetical protein